MSRTRAAASAVVARRPLRIVFAGDGALLIACAEKARQREHEIAAILTSSDEVAAWARQAGIPHRSIEGADELLAGHAADCLFSIYCFSIIPQRLLDLVPIAVNYHDAPLPRYAGFNAAAWAIFDGQREHGITWHRMTSDVDGGPIIAARRFPIADDETAFTLNLKCYEAGLDSFGPLLDAISGNAIEETPQDRSSRLYHRRGSKLAPGCRLDWNWSAEKIGAFVRAHDFGPSDNPLGQPKAIIERSEVAVRAVRLTDERSERNPGTVVAGSGAAVQVATATFDVVLTVDRDQPLLVDPREDEHLSRWRQVYDSVYADDGVADAPLRVPTEGQADPFFDISCWRDSAGIPIPETEMREWLNTTIELIAHFEPRNVLEIGCGKGLLLARLAPACESYCATDFSPKAIAHVRRHLGRLGAAARVSLVERGAHDLTGIARGCYDTIILNSVVQYFPSSRYLQQVVEGLLEIAAAGGRIVLGDIRNLRLLAAQGRSAADESELVIDPQFFLDLRRRFPRISAVSITPKRGRSRNELTRFRYDVVLHTAAGFVDRWAAPAIFEWSDCGSLSVLPALLQTQDSVAIRGIPNGRLAEGVEPEQLFDAVPAGWHCALSWHDCGPAGELDAIFSKTVRGSALAALAAETIPPRNHAAASVHEPLSADRAPVGTRSSASAPTSKAADALLRVPTDDARERRQECLRYTGSTLPDLFRERVAASPQAIAVRFRDETLTYVQLAAAVASVATELRARGVGEGSRVGVLLDRSIHLLPGLLGVLEAGAAYVPLDPIYPRERLQYMLDDAGVACVLVDSTTEGVAAGVTAQTIRIDSIPAGTGSAAAIEPSSPAYVIYTSGSTGRPKGVEVGHRSLSNLLLSMAERPGCGSGDRLLAVTTICFDIAALELYLPLITGGTVDIAPTDVTRDGAALLRELRRGTATMMQATPSTWKMLLAAGWTEPLNLVALCGGEALSRQLADEIQQRVVRLWNLYGPTETTIWSMVDEVRRNEPVSLGRPIANTRCYVLDEQRNRVSAGEAGELFIAGDGVAHGYVNRPELTEERFIPDPFSVDGGRMYRTGDRVRLEADGRITYIGRVDDQVKVAGYRIELGEIESALRRIDGIDEAVVVVSRDAGGYDHLVAHVRMSRELASDAIRAELRRWLPEYMMPAVVRPVAEFPLTLNRKIDRVRLAGGSEPAPSRGLTAVLRELAQAVVPAAGAIDTNRPLGEYGFRSIRFTALTTKIRERLGVELTPAVFYRFTTIEALAAHIAAVAPQASGTDARVASDREKPARLSRPHRAAGSDGDGSQRIAVIGMAARLPGGKDLDEFWEASLERRDMVREMPRQRPGAAEFLSVLRERSGDDRIECGFIDDIDAFDAGFFGISPREAELLDPRQRLLLESVWHAIEDASIDPSTLGGSRTGVFVGGASSEYWELQCSGGQPFDPYTLSGFSDSLLSNRISFLLNLRGPSAPIDTACSSSLVALHRARMAMLAGECDLAIVGGVNLIVSPLFHLSLVRGGYLSRQRRCRTFDRSADGYVRGEGVAALLLKPLRRAEADGDPIHAVLLGSAENHGGRAQSLTAPDQSAQVELLRTAYRAAAVDPATVTFIETHGTGTALGDPIEVNALKEAFAALYGEWGRKVEEPVTALGALKSSVGHLEAAAGLAAVVKVILAMERGVIPANLHLAEQNPYIDLTGSPFLLATENRPWQDARSPRRAGVSSFGFGGSNAHVVLESAAISPEGPPARSGRELIVLSARDDERLRDQAAALLQFVERTPSVRLADVALTLQVGRTAMEERLAFSAASVDELTKKLRDFREDVRHEELYSGNARADRRWAAMLEDAAGRSFVTDVMARGDLERLARLWTSGVEVPWTELPQADLATRIRLPGYRFARERFWIPGEADRRPQTADRGRIERTFSVGEPFLRDHVVRGQVILPAAAMIEIARAAVESASGRRVTKLRNLVWLQPALPTGGELRLRVEVAGDLTFTIDCLQPGGAALRCAQGTATAGEPPDATTIDINAIRERVRPSMDRGALYDGLRRYGLELGPSYCPVDAVSSSSDEALGSMTLPEGGGDFLLHPGMIDGALQVALAGLWGFQSRPLHLPFTMGEVAISGPLPQRCFVYVTRGANAGSFDLTLAGSDGVAALVIREFLLRPFRGNERSEVTTFAPEWLESERRQPAGRCVACQAAPAGDAILFDHGTARRDAMAAGGDLRVALVEPGTEPRRIAAGHYVVRPSVPEDYANLFDDLVRDGFDARHVVHAWRGDGSVDSELSHGLDSALFLIQAAAARSAALQMRLMFVHAGQSLLRSPWTTALAGFARSVALEHDGASVSVSASDEANDPARFAWLVERELHESDSEVLYAGGRRFVRTLRETAIAANGGTARDAVVLITGGAGGLGRIVSRHLAARGARMVLSGRSERSRAIEQQLETLRQLGGDAAYVQADVSRQDDVRRLVAETRQRFGRIDVVVHAAGVIHDARLVRKQQAQVAAVIAPKVAGILWLDDATASDPLQSFVIFSSVAAITGNVGQCDYAFANAFADGFAAEREERRRRGERSGNTISINWPLWRSGGMAVDRRTEEWMQATLGLRPMEEAAGVAAFDAALAASGPQIFVASGDLDRIRARFTARPAKVAKEASAPAPVAPIRDRLLALASAILKLEPRRIALDRDLGEFGFDSMTFTELANRLNAEYSLSLTPALFFERSTIDSIAEHLSTLVAREGAEPRSAVESSDQQSTATPAVSHLTVRPPRAQRQQRRESHEEPIAIVGAAAVLPGSDSLEGFWRKLEVGTDLISEVPPDRWDWREIDGDPRSEVGKTDCRWGGFIDGVDEFDARFFGISRREAQLMDPQQRIFLETVWRAIEDAGWDPSQMAGRRAGLFAGVCTGDYAELLATRGIEIEAHTSTGNARSILTNRISHLLDLRGPSEPIDTACSSSLVAVHRAMESLRSGSCDVAIAGGVNLILSPFFHLSFSRAGMLSPSGRCRTFDHRADGYVRGEGSAALVLKPLSAAERDGDAIHAVIVAGAVAHAGHANSLTAPNGAAQAQLLVDVYSKAGIDVRSVSYIEAHGTATRLGDPIEISALRRAFRELGVGDTRQPWCGVGSVKSNFGHLEAAAGAAGILKVMLSMQHRTLPPMLHFERLNPHIELEGSPFFIVDRQRPWDADEPRRAGVSSFGFGGVNAHVVIEEYPRQMRQADDAEQLLVVSARDRERLQLMAGDLATAIRELPSDTPLSDVAWTLQSGRRAMQSRLAIVGRDRNEVAAELRRFSRGESPAGLLVGEAGDEATAIRSTDLRTIAASWVSGSTVDWTSLPRASRPARVHLPAYRFARDRHWFEENGVTRSRGHEVTRPSDLTPHNRATAQPRNPVTNLRMFRPEWRQRHLEQVSTSGAGAALILTSRDSVELALELGRIHAGDAITVHLASETRRYGDRVWHLDAGDPSGLETLLAQLGSFGRVCILGAPLAVLWRFARAVARANAAPFELRIVTTGAYEIVPGELTSPAGAALSGFCKALVREMPQIRAACIDVGRGDAAPGADERRRKSAARAIADEPVTANSSDVAIRRGVRLERVLVPLTLGAPSRSPFRDRGTYLIVGGAGGIGLALGRHLARRASARIAIVGRRSAEAAAAALAAIEAEGGEALYLQADCSDRAAIRKAVAEVRQRFGTIAGVFHSALVLRDRAVRDIDDAHLAEVLAPKAAGTEALFEAVSDQPLDFAVVFSSVQPFLGNAGQTNYAAASALQDAIARNAGTRSSASATLGSNDDESCGRAAARPYGGDSFPARIVNWGYWGSVGVVASAEYRQRMEQLGLRSIEPDDGFAALEALLASKEKQVVCIDAAPELLRSMSVDDSVAIAPVDGSSMVPFDLSIEPPVVAGIDEYRAARGELEREGARAMRSILAAAPASAPRYERLVDALRGMAGESESGPSAQTIHQSLERLASEHPSIAPHARLLGVSAESFAAVVRGEKNATDVLFPNGSMDLVGPIYDGNPQAELLQRQMAAAVTAYCGALATGDVLRVLEIGAGTGGASKAVLEAIRRSGREAEYVYTDVSAAFLRQGEERFKRDYPFVRFAPLDIEKHPGSQDLAHGGFDLVIAANVLHATRRIAESIAHAKWLLRRGGWLLLQELTRVETFTTLTFGLLDGWWRFEDEHLRLAGSPLLDRQKWTDLLAAEGFETRTVNGPDVAERLFVARSDGYVRSADVLVRNDRTSTSDRVSALALRESGERTPPDEDVRRLRTGTSALRGLRTQDSGLRRATGSAGSSPRSCGSRLPRSARTRTSPTSASIRSWSRGSPIASSRRWVRFPRPWRWRTRRSPDCRRR